MLLIPNFLNIIFFFIQSALSSFPIIFRTPTDCVRDVNCTFYWAMGPNTANSDYLDVYMEGTAAGWMAVGFSENQIMVRKYCYVLC